MPVIINISKTTRKIANIFVFYVLKLFLVQGKNEISKIQQFKSIYYDVALIP